MSDDTANPITNAEVEAELAQDVQAAAPAPAATEGEFAKGTEAQTPDRGPSPEEVMFAISFADAPIHERISKGEIPTDAELADLHTRMTAIVPEGAPTLEQFKETIRGVAANPPPALDLRDMLRELRSEPTEEEVLANYRDVVIPAASEKMRKMGYSEAKISAVHELDELARKSGRAEVGEIPFTNAQLALAVELNTVGANKAGRAITEILDDLKNAHKSAWEANARITELDERIKVLEGAIDASRMPGEGRSADKAG